jgi:CoA-transferase family III
MESTPSTASRVFLSRIWPAWRKRKAHKQAAYDTIIQALSGIMDATGWPDGPATRVGTSMSDIAAGIFGYAGIVMGVLSLHNFPLTHRDAWLRNRRSEERFTRPAKLES